MADSTEPKAPSSVRQTDWGSHEGEPSAESGDDANPARVARNDSRRFFGPGARDNEIIAGRYRVVKEIGAGGMGQVVEVEHLELEKHFALKLIRPDRWDETLDARFRREAKSLARVKSPRVAQITDFGVDPDRGPFYVMELCEGEPLDVLIQREGALGTDRALRFGLGIAKALADVHAAGIVHRDIKPGNIAVAPGAVVEVMLMDFGLAASVDDRFGSRMTESKRVVGSMPYMAPEQFHGERPNISMDIWALGIVLYEMTTGRLPFDAPSTAALIHRILNERVPARGIAPAAFAPIFDRLLAKDPTLRCPSAEAAVELLENGVDPTVSHDTAEATRIDPSSPALAAPKRPSRSSTSGEAYAETAEAAVASALPWGRIRLVAALSSLAVIAVVGGFLLMDRRPGDVRAVPLEDPGTSAPDMVAVEPTPVEVVPGGPDLDEGEVTAEAQADLAEADPSGTDDGDATGEPASARSAADDNEQAGEVTTSTTDTQARRAVRRPPAQARQPSPPEEEATAAAPTLPESQTPEPPTWTGGIIESRRP